MMTIQSERFQGQMAKKNPPGFDKQSSDIYEADRMAVAAPLGPVVSIVEKPDPRRVALDAAKEIQVMDTQRRRVLKNLTDQVRARIRERINKGEYSADPLQVLCEFASDPNLDPALRIRAATAASEYLHTKKASLSVYEDAKQTNAEVAVEQFEAKKKRLASAVRAMLAPPERSHDD